MTLCQHCSLSFWRTVTLVCHVPLAQPWGCRHLSPYVSWQHCENHSGHGTNILSIWRSTNIFCLFMPKTTRVVESYFLLLHPCSSVRLWFLNRALLHCYCGLYHLLFSSICQEARFNHSTDFWGVTNVFVHLSCVWACMLSWARLMKVGMTRNHLFCFARSPRCLRCWVEGMEIL